MSISNNEFIQGAENADSDSEANSDDGQPDYYQPISAADDDEDDEEVAEGDSDHVFDSSSFENPNYFPNGLIGVQNGIYTLDLNNNGNNNNDEEEDEEERIREATDSEISRAFREDESRRNAPLTPENSTRIMDAMRGISLEGFAPDWINHVPEDRWIDQLRGLRRPPPSTTQN